jgi:uncharacterized repeat protein (TIGR03803 family)
MKMSIWIVELCSVFFLLLPSPAPLRSTTAGFASPQFLTLHSFDSTDGYAPQGTLAQAADGDLYGTTTWGGGTGCSSIDGALGCGTAFKISHGGTFASLYSFCATGNPQCPDGSGPQSGVILGSDSNLYGTTKWGGEGDYCCGTVFKLTLSGSLTTLYTFCGNGDPTCSNGSSPSGGGRGRR